LQHEPKGDRSSQDHGETQSHCIAEKSKNFL
jgi:hypothetical protein